MGTIPRTRGLPGGQRATSPSRPAALPRGGRRGARVSGAPVAVGADHPPEAAVEVDVVAADLAPALVRVVVERLAGVRDLPLAAAPSDGPEQRAPDAAARNRRAVGEDGRPRSCALAVADALALRVVLEDVDGLAAGVKNHPAELGAADLQLGASGLHADGLRVAGPHRLRRRFGFGD